MRLKELIIDFLFMIRADRWGKQFLAVFIFSMSVFAAYQKEIFTLPKLAETQKSETTDASENKSGKANRAPSSIPEKVEATGEEIAAVPPTDGETPSENTEAESPAAEPENNPPSKFFNVGNFPNLKNLFSNLNNANNSKTSPRSPSSTPNTQVSESPGTTSSGYINSDSEIATGTTTSGSGSGGSSLVTAPTITSVSPSHGPGPGGTLVTLNGSHFASGIQVSFSGSTCGTVTLVSDTQLTCVTSLHASLTVDVTVTNTDGGTATLLGAYTYQSAGPTQSLMWAGGSKKGSYGSTSSTTVTGKKAVILEDP